MTENTLNTLVVMFSCIVLVSCFAGIFEIYIDTVLSRYIDNKWFERPLKIILGIYTLPLWFVPFPIVVGLRLWGGLKNDWEQDDFYANMILAVSICSIIYLGFIGSSLGYN